MMLMKFFAILAGLMVSLTPLGMAAEEAADIFIFDPDVEIKFDDLPAEAKKILFYNSTVTEDQALLFMVDIKAADTPAGHHKINASVVEKIRQGLKDHQEAKNIPRNIIRFMWGDDQGKPLRKYPDDLSPFSIVLSEGESPAIFGIIDGSQESKDEESGRAFPTQAEARNQLIKEISQDAAARGADKYVVIIFDEDLKPRYIWPDYSATGDLIYVGITREAKKGYKHFEVEFSPCNLEPETPQLYIGDTSSLSVPQTDIKKYYPYLFPPRRCFNSTVEIVVKAGKDENNLTTDGRYSLKQYNRYRGTLQMGILFTDQHDVSFGLKEENGKSVLYNKGPVDKGPEYTASLVIYSFLRYIQDLFSGKKHFSGRDIVNEQTFADRLGAVVGVGLTNPGNRFVLGLSFEIAYGINLIGVIDYARLNELGAGLAEGAEYKGDEASIPIHRTWSHKLVFGLSMDLRYITALFSRR